jgi:hypothetical protein
VYAVPEAGILTAMMIAMMVVMVVMEVMAPPSAVRI